LNTKEYLAQTIHIHNQFQKVLDTCQKLLKTEIALEAKTYLNSRMKEKTQTDFQFGFFPSSSHLSLMDINILHELKLSFEINNLINQHTSFFEYHNLVFPVRDDYGFIIGLTGRTILSNEQQKERKIDKYKNSFYKKSHILFGLDQAKEAIQASKSVFLVEGQVDCIACHAAGFYNVVALGGPSLSLYQLYLLKKYGGTNIKILLLLDNDKAGKEGSAKIIQKYNSLAKIKTIELPSQFKDIDQYLKETGNVSFLAQY
jgi:DNA primase